jgi:hypothetical protein
MSEHLSDDMLRQFSHTMCFVTHRERLADWMGEHGFATGHGDNFVDLLKELSWQVKELKDQLWSYRKEHASK